MNVSQVYSNKGTFQTYHSKVKGTDGQLLLLEKFKYLQVV